MPQRPGKDIMSSWYPEQELEGRVLAGGDEATLPGLLRQELFPGFKDDLEDNYRQ